MLNQKGFTLIEILIVIAILGILVAIIAPNYIGFDYDARGAASRSNLGSLRAALVLYRVKIGDYPNTLAVLTTSNVSPDNKPVISKIPKEFISSSPGSAQESAVYAGDGGWVYSGGSVYIDWDANDGDSKWGVYSQEPASVW